MENIILTNVLKHVVLIFLRFISLHDVGIRKQIGDRYNLNIKENIVINGGIVVLVN